MEQVDLRKLDIAIAYVRRMSEGKHPVTNRPVQDDHILDDPNVIRCMQFIGDVLEQVRVNKGIIAGRVPRSQRDPFPFQVLENFKYEKDKPVSLLMRQIVELTGNRSTQSPGVKAVTNYLKAAGYLCEEVNPENNRKKTCITERGRAFGLYENHKISGRGEEYDVIMYGRHAQEFIVNNLERIVNGES